MKKKINWLDQFAMSEYEKAQKTASVTKVADQVIVDCTAYPNVEVGSFVDYNNGKYKVVDNKYQDSIGPGLLLEKVAEGEEIPVEDVPTEGGEVEASVEEKECGDGADCSIEKSAGIDEINEPSGEDVIENAVDILMNDGADSTDAHAEYPDTVAKPGGVKPIASDPNIGPGKKNVTDAPYHPTTDPGEQYAIDVPDTFQEAADRTADTISQEDAIDRTTVEGHFTWNQNIILDSIVNDPDFAFEEDEFTEEEIPEAPVEDEFVEEEIPELEDEDEGAEANEAPELPAVEPKEAPEEEEEEEEIPEK